MFRSTVFVERQDPSFKKYFSWHTHKDPKGTVKTQTVLEGLPTSLPLEPSGGFNKPMKKKKMTLKTPSLQKVTDEDFLLLEAFISEGFVTEDPNSEKNPRVNEVNSFH